jgi:hypothetical protein
MLVTCANFANKTEARDLRWCRCAESPPYQVASVQIRADMQMYVSDVSRYIGTVLDTVCEKLLLLFGVY